MEITVSFVTQRTDYNYNNFILFFKPNKNMARILRLSLSTETAKGVCTCWGDVRAAAHFQQFQGVTVVGHQHLQRWIIHWRVVNLERRQ